MLRHSGEVRHACCLQAMTWPGVCQWRAKGRCSERCTIGLTSCDSVLYAMCRQVSQMSEDELKEEFMLVGKIINHLIRVMGILVVVETPERAPSDSDTAYARRVQRERVLAVNPNFVTE